MVFQWLEKIACVEAFSDISRLHVYQAGVNAIAYEIKSTAYYTFAVLIVTLNWDAALFYAGLHYNRNLALILAGVALIFEMISGISIKHLDYKVRGRTIFTALEKDLLAFINMAYESAV
jgi:hypothetical protein